MRIAYACAYTPLPLLGAAGCTPYRVLPTTDAADQAGLVIHDNICPHVKRVLDRVMAPDLPEIDGVVLVNSCDAMRRLSDAWRRVRPEDPVFLLDLPPTVSEISTRWFTTELERLRRSLSEWTGHEITDDAIEASIARSNALAVSLELLRVRLRAGTLPGGAAAMQRLYNEISVAPLVDGLTAAAKLLAEPEVPSSDGGVPVHLFVISLLLDHHLVDSDFMVSYELLVAELENGATAGTGG